MNEPGEFLSSILNHPVRVEEAIHIGCVRIISLYKRP